MKAETVRKYYAEQTEKASKAAQQLSLAGIAVVWVFRDTATGVSLPLFLYLPTAAFVISLGAGLVQYWKGAESWYVEMRKVDTLAADEEHKVPRSVNRP